MNKFCMKKLPVGDQIHQKESKDNKRCCSYLAECKTDDHLLQCLKQSQHRIEIYQTITRLGTEIDPILHDILRDGVGKYIGGNDQTLYDEDGPANSKQYFHLQQTQQDIIGWDNLIRGKFSKHWQLIQREFTQTRKNYMQNKDGEKNTNKQPKSQNQRRRRS